jgi:hypothetical protein
MSKDRKEWKKWQGKWSGLLTRLESYTLWSTWKFHRKMTVFCDVVPCSLAEVYWNFRGACCLHHQGGVLHTALLRSPFLRLVWPGSGLSSLIPCLSQPFCMHLFITLVMEAVSSSDTSVSIYTTLHSTYITKHSHLHSCHCENLECHMEFYFVNLKGRNHMGHLNIDRRIILKWTLEE